MCTYSAYTHTHLHVHARILQMQVYAAFNANGIYTSKSYKYNHRITTLVKDALKKNKDIWVVSSDRNLKKSKYDHSQQYTNRIAYDTQINNMYDELTNEIVSDIEACVYDYPESYVSLVMTTGTLGYSHSDIIDNKDNEVYLIHCPE